MLFCLLLLPSPYVKNSNRKNKLALLIASYVDTVLCNLVLGEGTVLFSSLGDATKYYPPEAHMSACMILLTSSTVCTVLYINVQTRA